MIFTLRVSNADDSDIKGSELLAEINKAFKQNSIKKIRTAKVYRLEGISESDYKIFKKTVLVEPINQTSSNKKLFPRARNTIEIAYKPGVMNPEVASIMKVAKDININLKAADTSWEYSFFGNVSDRILNKVINRFLVNKTIERMVTYTPKTLLIKSSSPGTRTIPIRKLTDERLLELSKDKLFLNLEEMKVIQNYFQKIKRDPTDCEIEILAQTWSEHCVHKTFRAKLKIDGKSKAPLIERIKSTAKNNKKLIISAFDDNSGVIDFYDGFAVNGKVETHNSPSAIEPYGGAMTGSGGVFRDILGTGQGAKPVISTDVFCFAPPKMTENKIPPGCLPPTYLLTKVVAGVRDYGNRVGIPTNNGSIHFHEDFRAKPMVAVGSFGILPKKYAKKREPTNGDLILAIGGATGRDGIHGATFSSGEMSAKTQNVSGTAVQIGNAIEEKRLIDATLALRDQNLIQAITDCGAGGYSSAIGEMGKKIGAEVNLENVLLKYQGLTPWEIFLSESQERMVLAIKPKNLKKALEILTLYNVPSAVIGKFTNTKKLIVKYKHNLVANLQMTFLHEGLPQRSMIGTSNNKAKQNKPPKKPTEYNELILKVISHPNVASKESVIRMYDHNVQGTTVLHPISGKNLDSPNDGVVIKPLLKKTYGFVTAHGLNPAMVQINPYIGSLWALTEAVSNFVAIGGDIKDAALVDNFIWPFPDSESLSDLDKSVDACVDFANKLNMPFVSGKDSLSSTYRYPSGEVLKIPPTLLISVFGRIPNVKKTVSSDFKKTNSTIILVGKSDLENLGGTTYFDVTGSSSSEIPNIDLNLLPKVLSGITRAIKSGNALSVHDISEGGLVSALAEMCFGGDCGVVIDLSLINKENRLDYILFNETPGTFLIEVNDSKTAQKTFEGIPHKILGNTKKAKNLEIKLKAERISNLSIDRLKTAWKKPFEEIFNAS